MADMLMFKTPASESRLLVPASIIVIDAHALLLATQREAAMPGIGLSWPIRPLQGPVCAGCRCLSTECRVSGELEPTSLDSAMTRSASPTSTKTACFSPLRNSLLSRPRPAT